MNQPFISICIPAYKRTAFLKRLLDSISTQSYRDFEVVVTDDSPGNEVGELCNQYHEKFPIKHQRNVEVLGTPENWNQAIRLAGGTWIKLMHDDDWFSSPMSLQHFHNEIIANPSIEFFFSAYNNVFLNEGERISEVRAAGSRVIQLKTDPVTLFASNVIGPPSVTIHRNDGKFFYDNKLKWLVDIEFYIRYLKDHDSVYISKPLVNVGIGNEQVTVDCFRQRQVEIPESFYLLGKTGMEPFKNILVYDAWWRLMRNLEIRKKEDIRGGGYNGDIHPVIMSMVKWQRKFPLSWLKKGAFSKILMSLNYITNKKRVV